MTISMDFIEGIGVGFLAAWAIFYVCHLFYSRGWQDSAAATESEMKGIKARVEDALAATKAAIEGMADE